MDSRNYRIGFDSIRNYRYYYFKFKQVIVMANYRVLYISRLGTENGTPTFCEHCGRLIFNFAVIQGTNNGKYRVGLDCMRTLCKTGQPEARQLSINF